MLKRMKKWKRATVLCIIISLILSLSACGGTQKPRENGTSVGEDSRETTSVQQSQEEGLETVEAVDSATASREETAAAATTVMAAATDAAAAETTESAAETTATAAETAAAAAETAVPAAETADSEAMPDYSKAENWAYFDLGEQKSADLFLVCPTVDTKDEYNMSMNDEKVKKSFLGALNMERGIYEDCTRMFAPYYRQAALKIYDLSPEDREPYLELAYKDVSAAFSWYLENRNNGRPIVLAGFSQGADMCYRILKEYFSDSALQDQLVAVYAIGWPMTEEMISLNPQIKPAAAEDDTGVVVTFECESEELAETFICPIGQKGISINPLNWVTDSTPADKSLNAGACFTDYSGGIRREVTGLCGCYIDPERGVLKVTDVTPEEFPPILPILPEGSYHLYDYQFFFRNLQQNVDCRINSYLRNKTKDKE